MYQWRKISAAQRREVLAWRRLHGRPWHSPPHLEGGRNDYLITAACYEHAPVVGESPARLSAFSEMLLDTLASVVERISAWVVLPNHYHVVVRCGRVKAVLDDLGALHGSTSHDWNGEDNQRGRHVWHGAAERAMRNSAHHWATINYVHHNPVKHGYVEKWGEWPWSSAADFLASMNREDAAQIWRAYPIGRYGKGWDD